MGFSYKGVQKGVYVNGHEQVDVVDYSNAIFLPAWKRYSGRIVIFLENGSWHVPESLPEGEKPLVFITHDKSIFNVNDGKRRLWMKDGKQPLRLKGKGKGIIVSSFLTPSGLFQVPGHISKARLLEDPMWPMHKGNPI